MTSQCISCLLFIHTQFTFHLSHQHKLLFSSLVKHVIFVFSSFTAFSFFIFLLHSPSYEKEKQILDSLYIDLTDTSSYTCKSILYRFQMNIFNGAVIVRSREKKITNEYLLTVSSEQYKMMQMSVKREREREKNRVTSVHLGIFSSLVIKFISQTCHMRRWNMFSNESPVFCFWATSFSLSFSLLLSRCFLFFLYIFSAQHFLSWLTHESRVDLCSEATLTSLSPLLPLGTDKLTWREWTTLNGKKK